MQYVAPLDSVDIIVLVRIDRVIPGFHIGLKTVSVVAFAFAIGNIESNRAEIVFVIAEHFFLRFHADILAIRGQADKVHLNAQPAQTVDQQLTGRRRITRAEHENPIESDGRIKSFGYFTMSGIRIRFIVLRHAQFINIGRLAFAIGVVGRTGIYFARMLTASNQGSQHGARHDMSAAVVAQIDDQFGNLLVFELPKRIDEFVVEVVIETAVANVSDFPAIIEIESLPEPNGIVGIRGRRHRNFAPSFWVFGS